MNEHGYVDIDGLLIGAVLFGVVVGVVITYVLPWAWSLIKLLIHAGTTP